MSDSKRLQVQVGYLDKSGDEQFFFLEFDPEKAAFFYTIERISRTGETSSSTRPLAEASSERGYNRAIEWIKKGLFSTERASL